MYYAPWGKQIEYKPFVAEAGYADLSSQSQQFYPNMRYKDKIIGYKIEDVCDGAKKQDAIDAFDILSQESVLKFYENTRNPEIVILCSNIAPSAEEKDHFVAGEGGPSKIINTTVYSVILLGKVSLYKVDKCDQPKVAVHEILHALGFDHNKNPKSIMYPVTDCSQTIDQEIINDISRLYAAPSLPDLIIEKAEANRTSRYVDFQVVISNLGLKDSEHATLEVYAGDTLIKEFNDLNDLSIGRGRIISVTNLFLTGDIGNINFVVKTNEEELSKANNIAEVSIE